MISILLITVPLICGVILFFVKNDIIRRMVMVGVAACHLIFTGITWFKGTDLSSSIWFAVDDVGMIFLLITSILFFGASLYCINYLKDESLREGCKKTEGRFFSNESVFSGCFLLFLATMTIVITSRHLAVLWVGIEATTLVSAPLIYFHKTKRSLEATWKYLLICSVGIALALLGVFFLAVANNNHQEMFFPGMIKNAVNISVPWLKAAFLLLFVGYGTKMGLAPFHAWLPDAHSEAPSVVSALLSGALLNCAFLGILRIYQICIAAGLQVYCQEIFIFFGILSLLVAAVFILGQTDYKRMLAYSSVEHMGIITLGLGLGGGAVLGALFGILGHSLTKAGLFFVAGNILSYFRTKKISDISGLISGATRLNGVLWLVGFLLITGTPPSGIFLGKFIILKEALLSGHYWTAFIFLFALAVVFIGMARIFIMMVQGNIVIRSNVNNNAKMYGSFVRTFVPCIFFILAIAVGFYLPVSLSKVMGAAVKELGGVL